MRKGFTLIELLVVVLIIGILAAVALPQYEKAVIKSKVAVLLPWLKELKRGRDLYVLEGGTKVCLDLEAFAQAAGISYFKSQLLETNRKLYCDTKLWVTQGISFHSVNGGILSDSFKPNKKDNTGFFIYMVLNPSSAAMLDVEVGSIFCMPSSNWGDKMCAAISASEKRTCRYGSSSSPCYQMY